nr:helix-turn-helix domain-containing protein [Microbacterium sp. TL13]
MLVGVVVASLRGEQSRTIGEGYSAALSIIAARVGDPDLTPAAVAAELNTSLRSLQRQFAAHDTTMDRSIRAARVAHATSLLEDPVYRSLTIERVAHACGLANGSSLARAFAAEGLPSPAAVRAAARRR